MRLPPSAGFGLLVALLFGMGGSASAAPVPRRPGMRTGIRDMGSGRKLSNDEIRALLTRHGFPNVEAWLRIILHESGGNPEASVDTRGLTDEELHAFWRMPPSKKLDPRGEYAIGLFQINTVRNTKYPPEALKDPDTNAAYAFELSNHGTNFGPWKQ